MIHRALDGVAFDPGDVEFQVVLRAHDASSGPTLADHADMSMHAFIRRFRDEVGTTPG